jgi:hypothetical protein
LRVVAIAQRTRFRTEAPLTIQRKMPRMTNALASDFSIHPRTDYRVK